LSAGHNPKILLSAPELTSHEMDRTVKTETLTVSKAVFKKVSYRENPDGWIAVFPTPKTTLEELKLGEAPLLIVAEAIEKPGNLGGMLRTADAAGVDGVLLCDPLVDLYNPNVVRASRGTLFTVPTVESTNQAALQFLQDRGIKILAATPQASADYTRQDLRGPLAIAIGTEDEGLTDFWMKRADISVRIPMKGKVNSLNVSVATALIIYEAVRQRER